MRWMLKHILLIFKALGERNYHIFYCMLAGITAEEKKALALSGPVEYMFLTKVLQQLSLSFTWNHNTVTFTTETRCRVHASSARAEMMQKFISTSFLRWNCSSQKASVRKFSGCWQPYCTWGTSASRVSIRKHILAFYTR